MKKNLEFRRKKLAKLMAYILGRRPDEFGLVLDEEGFVSLKELRQAVSEEEGWAYVKISHMEEAARGSDGGYFEIHEGRIRLRGEMVAPQTGKRESVEPPPLLYFAARRKAYAHILRHGLEPSGKPFVPLAVTEELAVRMGRRRDSHPVFLTIQAQQAYRNGCTFTRPNELIYLAGAVPVIYISGPPLEQVAETLPRKPQKQSRESTSPPVPAYDTLRMAYQMEVKPKRKREGDLSWKQEARKYRRRRRR